MLAHWIETTDESRIEWAPAADPASKTRSVLDVARECVRANQGFALMLAGGESVGEAPPANTREEAATQIRKSAQSLATVVRGLDDSTLDSVYQTPMGAMPGRVVLGIALGHMFYHGGQVNMVQLLYGDTEFRYPR